MADRRLAIRLATAAVLAAVTVSLLAVMPVHAQDDLEENLATVNAQLDQVASSIEAAEGERSDLATSVVATRDRVDLLLGSVAQVTAELGTARQAVREQAGRIAAVTETLERFRQDLAITRAELKDAEADAEAWALQLYMTGGSDQALVVLATNDLNELGISMAYLSVVSRETDRTLLDFEALRRLEQRQISSAANQQQILEQEQALLVEEEARVSDLLAEQVANQRAAEIELANEHSLLATVEDEIAHFEGELAALEVEQDRIRDAIRTEAAKAAAAGTEQPEVSSSGWVRPVPGAVTSGFGPRLHPILGYYRMHTGWDMSAGTGTPIASATAGTVILAGWFGGYGNTVVVDHGGGLTTLYAHQSSLAVSYGSSVGAGDVVGYVGSTGLSTGPHLHFEVRVDGNPVDPAGYL